MSNILSDILKRADYTFIRYCLVGLANTALCLMMMRCGSRLGLSYLYYTPIGYGLAILNSYFLNAWFTFEEKQWDKNQLKCFLIINVINLLGVEWCEYALIEKLFLPESMAVLLSMVLYTVLGFILNRQLVFRVKSK